MTIFRFHIRPKGGSENSKVSFSYCLKGNLLGAGWQIDSNISNIGWDEYEKTATKMFGRKNLTGIRYIKNNIRSNDLIWTRSPDGIYYLGKVESEWEYYSNPEAQEADIVNIVRCNLIKIPNISDIPGKVIASFRPTRTVQAIHDRAVDIYSKHLWNKISGSEFYQPPNLKNENLFSLLDSEETEDIIFIFLQTKGWIVIPNSRKGDTMSYEFYLIHNETKEKAIVQVKTGHTSLNTKDWKVYSEKVFLFQSNSIYHGESSKNIECISPDEIKTFIHKNRDLLPSNIIYWLNLTT